MHTFNHMRRIFGLLALCLVLISTSGCNKLLATWSQGQAEKNRNTARDKHEAEKFQAAALKDANAAITKSQSDIAMKQYAQARISAKESADKAKSLLAETIRTRAEFLRKEAGRWVGIAKKNEAIQIDGAKFDAITALNDHGINDQFDKKKFEASIETFNKVILDTQALLYGYKTRADEGLKDAVAMREELVKEGAEEFDPSDLLKMDEHIKDIARLIKDPEYDYLSAFKVHDQAAQTRINGLKETRRKKSDKQINEIEGLALTAKNLKSNIFAAQSDANLERDQENLLLNFTQGDYPLVLKTAPAVKQKAEALIQETKVNAAKMQLASARQEITRLTDDKARTYLPGRVEQIDELTSKAQSEIDQQLWVEARATAERALAVVKNIDDEFDAYAQNEVHKASEQLGAADATFKTMEQIFEKKIPGEWTGSDAALENAKQTLKSELQSRLSTANLSLALADQRRIAKDFDVAIEIARKVGESAEFITGQTFRIVSHNAILEISNELTRYEREGGRQYARVELDKTHTMLDETKGLLDKEQYRQAVRRAADTKAQLSILYQELERVAVSRIDSASTQMKQARDSHADKYQTENLAQAVTLLDQARDKLERGANMREAIEAARNAEDIANKATQESLRQWAQDMSRQSEILIGRAGAAGAARFAPEKFQQAQTLRRNLDEMIAQNHYEQAVEIGAQAVDAADGALMAEINQAEDAIASARRFGGFDYQPERLAHAGISLKSAREDMEAGRYQKSQIEAQEALMTALDVTAKAKKMGFADQIDSLKARLDQADKTGAGLYQVKDVSRIMGEMNKLRNDFDPKNYQDYADKVRLLEAQLAGLMESTPDALKTVTTGMQERLTQLEERGARRDEQDLVRDIENKIKYAQLDFKNEKYRSSFENVKDASKLLDTLQVRLDERRFDTELTQHLNDFTKQFDKFGIVLNMGSGTMLRMAIGPQGKARAVSILSACPPAELRNELTQINGRIERMQVPPTRLALHEATLNMFKTAKLGAANFEKCLILDQYSPSDASSIIQSAYLQMLKAKQEQQKIQKGIEHPKLEEKASGVEREITLQGM